jgi:hypothetical protein
LNQWGVRDGVGTVFQRTGNCLSGNVPTHLPRSVEPIRLDTWGPNHDPEGSGSGDGLKSPRGLRWVQILQDPSRCRMRCDGQYRFI